MRRWLRLDWFMLLLPVALLLRWQDAPPPWIFLCAGLAIIPLAGWMGRATEALSSRLGAGIGSLLNATFGNAAELILGALALKHGLVEVVKASITGSILGNLLLVGGMSIVAGGLRRSTLSFNRTAANLGGTLLAVSVAALLIPAVFHEAGLRQLHEGRVSLAREAWLEHNLSLTICAVLFLVYVLNLLFALRTHKDLFRGREEEEASEPWSRTRAGAILGAATLGVTVASETLVSAIEPTAHALGLSDLFMGVILLAIIGNAAEHSTAIVMARKNKMDISLGISIGSSLQIALVVAPILVFLSYALGKPMDLRFSAFETLSVALAVGLTNLVVQDGESHWMEGVLLLALYAILGYAFFALPV